MARNSESTPSEPSGRRPKPAEGGSRLRQHFRDSIRDALSGVDVDELQGQRTLRVPSDVSLLTRDTVTDLEAELAALRAERAELARKAAARRAVLEQQRAGVAAVVEAPAREEPGEAAPAVAEVVGEPVEEAPPRAARWPWRRGRLAAVEVEPADQAQPGDGNGAGVAWSVARAMEPVVDGPAAPAVAEVVAPAHEAAVEPAAAVVPATDDPIAAELEVDPVAVEAPPAEVAPPVHEGPVGPAAAVVPAPETLAAEAETSQTAPPQRSPRAPVRRRRPAAPGDSDLESVVAPLLAELANLRQEVRQLRGDPEAAGPTRLPSGRQLVRLVAGLLLGFALIAIALIVVLKA
ncbi:MAG TPA: hypothetical protein VFC09_14735 [Candidatus Dormibacteraeota bacterium]|nr:hypothetical protein [Candidatus Dormibacteraeota bacterium]